MSDWIAKLDDFLKLSEKRLLVNAGKVSVEQATAVAEAEFGKYKKKQNKNLISDFDQAVNGYLKGKNGKK